VRSSCAWRLPGAGDIIIFTVYPSVDISQGRCLRLLRGRDWDKTCSDDPAEVAAAFCRAGASWIHVVDLDAARTGEPVNRKLLVEVVAGAGCAVQASGGLRIGADMAQLFEAGARRVVASAAALEAPAELAAAARRYPERIALSLDARGRPPQGERWAVGRGPAVLEAIRSPAAASAWGFVYRSVERDGTLEGPDLEGLTALFAVTQRPVIAAGGVGSLAQLAALRQAGAAGAIVGRALYEGAFSLDQALALEG
jgi:phosphoribosylformimino-5-aminoimidazole carboxamide ribotide isomerase